MDLMKAQAVRWGTHLIEADADEIDLTQRPFRIKADGQTMLTHALVIATGASANRLRLAHRGALLEQWHQRLCDLRWGHSCSSAMNELAVVGGGDSACEEAVYLTKYGSHVHLIVRSEQLRASAAMADRVMANPAITVHWNSEIEDVAGGEWMEGLTLRNRVTSETRPALCEDCFMRLDTPNTDLLKDQIESG